MFQHSFFSKICGRFRCDYGRETEEECVGALDSRGEGKGLKIPVDYRLTGNLKYLENFYQGGENQLMIMLIFQMSRNARFRL